MNFIQSSLAAKAFTSCPNELRTRKFIYMRFQQLSYLFIFKIFTPKQIMSEPSTPGDSTLATLTVFNLYFIGGTAHWLNRHRDSLEVTQDLHLITFKNIPVIADEKSERYMLRYISISRKVQPLFNFVYGLWL